MNKVKLLQDRLTSEKNFHENKYSQMVKKKTLYDLGFTSPVLERMLFKIKDVYGKKVVDFGCGTGWLSELLLSQGAEVWAFDISEEAVKKSREAGIRMNMAERIHAQAMAAEDLVYEDNFFDIVVGAAILHHLDLRLAAKQIHRVLKRGGKAVFIEPLGHNPIINIYRKMTPKLRSPDEKPLCKEDLLYLQRLFNSVEIETHYFLSIFALFWYYVISRPDLMIKTRNILSRLDKCLMKAFPAIKKFCWYAIITLEK
jgi:ubiquinone/menaquinone biosynthesis C-methylase UbiE